MAKRPPSSPERNGDEKRLRKNPSVSLDPGSKPPSLSEIVKVVGGIIEELCGLDRGKDLHDSEGVKIWAGGLQRVIENFNLHVSCISSSTYLPHSEKTGSGDQHLSTLSSEIFNSQEQVSHNVSRRLENGEFLSAVQR